MVSRASLRLHPITVISRSDRFSEKRILIRTQAAWSVSDLRHSKPMRPCGWEEPVRKYRRQLPPGNAWVQEIGCGQPGLQQGPYLPVWSAHQGLVFGRWNRPLGVPARYNKHVLIVLPIAPDDFALEGATRADRHRQNLARLRNGLQLDPFAESNVTVCDGFRGLLPLATDAEGRNPETYLDCLRHLNGGDQNALLHDRTSQRSWPPTFRAEPSRYRAAGARGAELIRPLVCATGNVWPCGLG